MRVICKTQMETVVFESTNITFSGDGYVYCKTDDIKGKVVRFAVGDQNMEMTKVTLARDGYIDLTNAMIEYYDDWNHKYISEKDIIEQTQRQAQQAPVEEPTKVEGEVVE